MEKGKFQKKVLTAVIAILLMIFIAIIVELFVHKNSSTPVSITNGLSAYELAVENGYEGTLQDWINSLSGKSAYEIAVENGYKGTEAEWTSALNRLAESDVVGIKTASFNSNGELVLTLTDNTVINLGKVVGVDGKNGTDGKNGSDGKNGTDGKNGADGKDGVGIIGADVNKDGELVLTFSDGHSINLDKIVGNDGKNGMSAFEIARNAGLTTAVTETEWLKELKGEKGEDGENGKSAYEMAVDLKLTDAQSEEEWLKTLKGEKGAQGDEGVGVQKIEVVDGELNITLSNGTTLELGEIKGKDGKNGLSAYEIALITQKTTAKSEAEWIESLKGEKGDTGEQGEKGENGKSAYELAVENNLTTAESEAEWLEELETELKGENGKDGKDGENGKSAFEIAQENGFDGTKEAWLESLKGEKGETGAQGLQGEKGETGAQGEKGDTGADGIGISKAEITSGELILTFSDDHTINLGKVVGADGAKGDKGDTGETGAQGIGIADVKISTSGILTVYLTNETEINLGNVKGADGVSVVKSELTEDGKLKLTYSNGESDTVGPIVGKDGVGIKTISISDAGDLSITTTDNMVHSVGNIKGPKGDKGDAGAAGQNGRGIAKTELIDGELWVTYTDGKRENLGAVTSQSTDSDTNALLFKYQLLEDGSLAIGISDDYKNAVEEIRIPSSFMGKTVTQIGYGSVPSIEGYLGFWECASLKKVIMPDTITTINNNAFYRCNSLVEVIFSKSITSIKNSAFSRCTALANVDFSQTTLLSLGNQSFLGCESLVSVKFSSSLTEIGSQAFQECSLLEEITIPESVMTIGSSSFKESGLKNAYFEHTTGWQYRANANSNWSNMSSTNVGNSSSMAGYLCRQSYSFQRTD